MILTPLLIALREQCRATIAVIDAALAQPEPIAPSGCQHPPEARRAAPRMGAPNAYICTACNMTVNTATDVPAQEG